MHAPAPKQLEKHANSHEQKQYSKDAAEAQGPCSMGQTGPPLAQEDTGYSLEQPTQEVHEYLRKKRVGWVGPTR